jgi:hypothetical protein
MRRFALAALALAMAAPAFAQAPEGWTFRVDPSRNPNDPDRSNEVAFAKMDPGFHVTTGPAAVLYNPKNVATGTYTLKGTFHLMKPSGHNNYYGLVFGGDALDGPGQNYLYFLVGQNGSYIVTHRAGASTHAVQPRTMHEAVVKPGADGKSANTLEVRVGADKIDYVINNVVVHTTPKTGMTSKTDGIWGVRINHQLDVHVTGLGVTK